MTSRSGPCWPVAGSWIVRIARCTEDWTFLMRQGRREFPLGLRTVLACLAFAEREARCPSCRRIGGLISTGGINDDDARRGELAMDVFKAWPGRAESIVIGQESYMGCTGGVAPWRRDGDTGPSYAVCPLCDNPIRLSACSAGRRKAVRAGPTGGTTGATCRACAATTRTPTCTARMRIRTIGRTPERDVIRRIRQVGPCMVSCAASSTG